MGRTKKAPKKRTEVDSGDKMDTETGSSFDAPDSTSDDVVSEKRKKMTDTVPRGIPKSGRVWKTPKQKFSTIKKSLHRQTFQKKEQFREEMQKVKELSKSIKMQKQAEKEQLKERREANEKRKLENQRKSEIVQIIKNPAKLKRIRKKQLRSIEKRDLSTVKAI
ncbi:coiled-coil domain-containing protein 86 [Phlebotomus argentipes]|uniref:coiled-coil domain-containing protein 86 n=1 Tax=Phlebotomus argentipes TaxID=94469 RepID=UPI0028933CA5|nr:coiled-coil domain-containing protein 86 [Phlebotomus argentipes]